MEKHINTGNINDFWRLLYPAKLEDNECVRILGTISDQNGNAYKKVWFVKSSEELQQLITENRYKYNLYCNLSTVRNINGNPPKGELENLYRRKVLFLDFDRKHFGGRFEHNDVVKLVKARFPRLFYAYTVDSGNGFHVYYKTEETTDTELIAKLNYAMAEAVGADMEACKTTQVVRIPTSTNLKDRANMKSVNTVVNAIGKARPVTLRLIQHVLLKSKKTEVQELSPPVAQFAKTNVCFYCAENMIATGAAQGSRNFCIGRIVNYLRDIRKCTDAQALKIVHEFNDRCRPPKPKGELESEFRYYWRGNYWLLGCKIKDLHKMAILESYCDKYACRTVLQYEESFTVEDGSLTKIDNEYFKEKHLKTLSGYHYLILSILLDNDGGLTTPQLKHELINKKTKKPCMKDENLYMIINNLEERNIIESTVLGRTKHLKVKDIPNYCRGYTQISNGLRSLVVNRLINKNDYLVYMVLVHRCRHGEKCTQDKLAELVGLTPKTIRDCIQRLKEAYVLEVVSIPTGRGLFYNRYKLKI